MPIRLALTGKTKGPELNKLILLMGYNKVMERLRENNMSKEKVILFDTTLRDGQQTQGVDFSVQDKVNIAKALDNIGIDYIEGGWPGANPTDTKFLNRIINFQMQNLLHLE